MEMKKTITFILISSIFSFSVLANESPALVSPENGENLDTSKKHTMDYFGCVKSHAIKYSKTKENVEAIAIASVASCENYIEKITKSNVYWLNSSQQGKLNFVERLRNDGERVAIKFAMDERAKTY